MICDECGTEWEERAVEAAVPCDGCAREAAVHLCDSCDRIWTRSTAEDEHQYVCAECQFYGNSESIR